MNEVINNLNKSMEETNFGVAKDIVKYIFDNIEADTQEELNVKTTLLKQAFLNQFELAFEVEFLNASENLD
ncbi:hypothetical protein [Lederbergia lenta]|uniref:hypothetical protein n=1 Tax=Lederbergia lenta TaxID=1467 RepID=UPI00203A6786|nr:hypothetical protein [Lederbergia lenta]MCM3109986.1 hypothetical protein [Lederbergia lenta]